MTKVVAFTGAGISKASGIPTFEEMGDLRDKLSRDYFQSHPEVFYSNLLEMKKKIDEAKPNDAHLSLAQYGIPIITMNIDGLHSRAGSEIVVEMHGNLEFVFCANCDTNHPFDVLVDSHHCEKCRRIYEPNVVLYGDTIPHYMDAVDLLGEADRLLVVGTSFYTSTANGMVHIAESAGKKVDIINENSEDEVPIYLESLLGNGSK
ncbi:MAG: transcriptional regulator [Clostridia bacterium]|nr:transcriptional regulator [Clostridia bacterium]